MSVPKNAKPAVQKQAAMAALVCAKHTRTMLQNDSRLCGTVVSSVSLLFYHPEVKKVQQKRPGSNWLPPYYLLVNKRPCWLSAATAGLSSARFNGAGKFLYKETGRWLLYRFRNLSADLFWSMHSKENLHTRHSQNWILRLRPIATILQGSSPCGYWLRSKSFLFARTDALPGKVAERNPGRSSSDSRGANKIILHREVLLTGDNEALVAVDGVVINKDSGHCSAIGAELGYGSDHRPAGYASGSNESTPNGI